MTSEQSLITDERAFGGEVIQIFGVVLLGLLAIGFIGWLL